MMTSHIFKFADSIIKTKIQIIILPNTYTDPIFANFKSHLIKLKHLLYNPKRKMKVEKNVSKLLKLLNLHFIHPFEAIIMPSNIKI